MVYKKAARCSLQGVVEIEPQNFSLLSLPEGGSLGEVGAQGERPLVFLPLDVFWDFLCNLPYQKFTRTCLGLDVVLLKIKSQILLSRPL